MDIGYSFGSDSKEVRKVNKWESLLTKIFPFVLCFYFIGTFIPNIVSWSSPLQAFFTSGVTKLIWRALVALIYGGFMIFAFIVIKPKVDKRLLSLSFIAFAFLLISPLFNLSPISFSVIDQWLRLVHVDITVGFVEIVGYYADTFFSLIFLLSLFFVVPHLIRKSPLSHLVFYAFIAIMAFCCLFSFIAEASIYSDILKGDNNAYEEAIKSIFPSKNAFGAFLSQAFSIAIYMLVRACQRESEKLHPKYRIIMIILWSILAGIFGVTLMFTFNKNGIGSMLVFAIAVIGLLLIKKYLDSRNKNERKKIGISTAIYGSILLIGIIFIISYPRLLDTLLSSVEGRNHVVKLFFNNLDGERILVGFGHSFGYHLYSWSFMAGRYIILDNIHNAFLTVLGTGGILYLAFYIGLIIYAFYILIKRRNNLLFFVVSMAILISFLFASLFESTQLFISGSSGSSLMSLLIISFPLAGQAPFIDERKDEFFELKVGQ